MRAAVLAFGVIALVAPAFAQNSPAAVAEYQSEKTRCEDGVSSRVVKTATEFEMCVNNAMRSYLTVISFPWMDLQNVNEAGHVANGRNFDAGRISKYEWAAADLKIDSDFTTSLNQRVATTMQARAAQRDETYTRQMQQLQAAQGLLAPRVYQAPSPVPAPPITTNCTTNGAPNGFTCTTQ